MRNDFWSGRPRAAMIPPFMLPREGPVSEGEWAALFVPGNPLQLRRRIAGNDL